MDDELQLIAIVGSLRAGANSRVVLETALELAPAGVTLTEVPIAELPFYDGDLEERGHPEVHAWADAVRRADGLVVVTPEYNHSVPALTKNALDWVSRPKGAGSIAGKPVGVVSSTPGRHDAAGVRDHLATSIDSMDAARFSESLGIASVTRAIEDGRLTDPTVRDALAAWLAAFTRFAADVRARQPAA